MSQSPKRRLACLTAVVSVLAAPSVLAQGAAAPRWTVLHSVELARTPVDQLEVGELSGLAWDADEQVLHAVSDRGRLFSYTLRLDAQRRQIEEVTARHGVLLRPKDGSERKYNAEGLDVVDGANGKKGDSRLLVALENGPRLIWVSPDGVEQGEAQLPALLADPKSYPKGNNRLESVSNLADVGIVTAPQRVLRDQPDDVATVYSLSGQRWHFAVQPKTAIKAIEQGPAGQMVVLERHGGGKRSVPALRLIDPKACAVTTAASETAREAFCQAPAVELDALEIGDNYEGLARLADDRYLMVSDNGGAARSTKLVLIGLER